MARQVTKHPGDTFTITWHPFELNPHAPKRSTRMSTNAMSALKEQPVEAVHERLRSAGKDAGINFRVNRRTGNTLDSHRIMELARQKEVESKSTAVGIANGLDGVQTRLVEELFADYFEREKDITDHDVLVKAARRAGLDEEEANTFLASDAVAEKVQKEAEAARREGVNGVPQFTINDVFEVQGAQEPNAFLMLFEKLKNRERKVAGTML